MLTVITRSQASQTGIRARYRADSRGAIAPIAGLLVLVLFGTVGGAVDFGQAYVAKQRLQSAIDTAALAGARTFQMDPNRDKAAAEAKALGFFASAVVNSPGATATATLDTASGTMAIEASNSISTPFLSILGLSTVTVTSRAEATASAALGGNGSSDVELSLMLDVTGSMNDSSGSGGSKLDAMKTSAKNLIDILIQDSGPVHAKVALAPFSRTVNVGDYVDEVTGKPLTKVVNGETRYLKRCVTERLGTEALTDAKPDTNAWIPAYPNPSNPYVTSLSSARDCSPNHVIMPLSSDKVTLKGRIDSFTGNGYTAGALGTAWAWYLLSPNWSNVFTGTAAPRAYGTDKLRKIAVLLTDGTYNTLSGTNYSDGSSQAVTISQRAADICSGMKAKGIEVFTIGFKLDNDLARNTMRDCATDASHAFLAENADQLNAAFFEIAYRAVPLHLSR